MDKTTLETEIGYRLRTASRNFISAAEITAELNRSLDRLNGKIDLSSTITEDHIVVHWYKHGCFAI